MSLPICDQWRKLMRWFSDSNLLYPFADILVNISQTSDELKEYQKCFLGSPLSSLNKKEQGKPNRFNQGNKTDNHREIHERMSTLGASLSSTVCQY